MTLAYSAVTSGFFYGTGAALNIPLGFVPDKVDLLDITAGNVTITEFPSSQQWAFASGGAGTVNQAINPGHVIVGKSSGATAQVKAAAISSGSFAGGNAAGTLILDPTTITGTFSAGEAVYVKGGADANPATGNQSDAVMTGNPLYFGLKNAAGTFTADTGVSAFVGSTTAGPGFSLSASDDTNGHLFQYTAYRT